MTTETKMFEIRDRFTLMAVIAIRARPDEEPGSASEVCEQWLLRRSGYLQSEYTFVVKINDGSCQAFYDPYQWPDKTMIEAHRRIHACWETLKSGEVIDCEHLRGDRPEPKISERLS